MNSVTKTFGLPPLTADSLNQVDLKIDNAFSTTWKSIGFNNLLRQANFSKRSGKPVGDVTYLLMLWVWLKVGSVAMFSKDALLSFSATRGCRKRVYQIFCPRPIRAAEIKNRKTGPFEKIRKNSKNPGGQSSRACCPGSI